MTAVVPMPTKVNSMPNSHQPAPTHLAGCPASQSCCDALQRQQYFHDWTRTMHQAHTHPTKRARAVLGLLSPTARPCSYPGRQHCATGGIEFPVAQFHFQKGSKAMLTLTALIGATGLGSRQSKQASRSSNHPKVGLQRIPVHTTGPDSTSRLAAAECKQRQHAL